jgi:hypothetical protein
MERYKCLQKQEFRKDEYAIIPIRYEDRLDIMKWRNDQMYHLRQDKLLTEKDQELYFQRIILPSFNERLPAQILFSFVHNEKCIGYGGLVHINWQSKEAEVSFIMATELEALDFEKNWVIFLHLLEKVAFTYLKFHRLVTYAFDLRPHLYKALEISKYIEEARLKNHYLFNDKLIDVVIHAKKNNYGNTQRR